VPRPALDCPCFIEVCNRSVFRLQPFDESLPIPFGVRHDPIADLVVVANCGQRGVVSIVPSQLVSKANQVLAISRIADIVHVPFRRIHGRAFLVHEVH
jgi:hypothetical protein